MNSPETPRRSSRHKRSLLYSTHQAPIQTHSYSVDPGLEFIKCELNSRILSGESVYSRLENSYRLFCSKRHLHYVVNYTGLMFLVLTLLSSSTFFFFMALVCFIWYYFLRPKVIARVSNQVVEFSLTKSKKVAHKYEMAAVYVAETRFYLKSGRAILGLYLDQDVAKL